MLEILIAYIKATFQNSMPQIAEIHGLAEKITDGPAQYPALYCTGGEYKPLSDFENYLYFRQTGPATEDDSDEESTTGCAYLITRTYPMVAVAYIPKSVYNTDNAFIDGKVAQNIANIITLANWQSLSPTLKTETVYTEVRDINTDRQAVWAEEYRNVEFAARLDHVYVAVEFDIVVTATETCLQNYDCNDAEVAVDGDTITVSISDADAWHKTGDTVGGVKKLGTLNAHDWTIIRNDSVIVTIQADGVNLNTLNARATPGTIFLTTENGVVKFRTAAQVRTDIGAGTGSVSSVGLQSGTSGTDVNITGSPVTGSGVITINIPTASAANRGVVSAADWSTFNNKIGTLNGLTGASQSFAVGTAGTDFNISSSGTTHSFNIPDASGSARGLVTTGAQTIAGAKVLSNTLVIGGAVTADKTLTIAGVGVDGAGARIADTYVGNWDTAGGSTFASFSFYSLRSTAPAILHRSNGELTIRGTGGSGITFVGSGNTFGRLSATGFWGIGTGSYLATSRFQVRGGSNNESIFLAQTFGQANIIEATEVAGTRRIGFFGVTAAIRQVVPTGSSTDTVITALQNLGLFSQT